MTLDCRASAVRRVVPPVVAALSQQVTAVLLEAGMRSMRFNNQSDTPCPRRRPADIGRPRQSLSRRMRTAEQCRAPVLPRPGARDTRHLRPPGAGVFKTPAPLAAAWFDDDAPTVSPKSMLTDCPCAVAGGGPVGAVPGHPDPVLWPSVVLSTQLHRRCVREPASPKPSPTRGRIEERPNYSLTYLI